VGAKARSIVPLSLSGTHSVEAFEWWGPADVQDGNTRSAAAPALASKVLDCPVAPPATPPTTTPPVTTPPAAVAPVTTPIAPAPAAASGIAGAIAVRSAPARLTVARSCATRSARLTITGRFMRRVTITLDGRPARAVTVRAGARSIAIAVPLHRSGAARQTVRVHVTFRNGASARNLHPPQARGDRGRPRPPPPARPSVARGPRPARDRRAPASHGRARRAAASHGGSYPGVTEAGAEGPAERRSPGFSAAHPAPSPTMAAMRPFELPSHSLPRSTTFSALVFAASANVSYASMVSSSA
jgi:hypothetical protein